MMLDWLDPPWIRNPWYPAWILLNYYPWQPSTTLVFLRIFTFPKKEPVRRLWYMKANEDHGCQSRTFDDLRRSNSPDRVHLVVEETRVNGTLSSKIISGNKGMVDRTLSPKIKRLWWSYARSDGWTILSNILQVRQLLMVLTRYQGWFFYFMMWHSFILPQGPWCLC